MLDSNLKNSFPDEEIVNLLKTINKEYFIVNSSFYINPPNSGFIEEEHINSNKISDDESRILRWLFRIQRYFLVSFDNEGENSKKNTLNLINDFLKDFSEYPELIKEYMCTNQDARNCLVFSLLESDNKQDWQLVLELIKQYDKNAAILSLLEGYYTLYFVNQNEGSVKILEDWLVDKDILPELSISPITRLFVNVALTQWYIKNPNTHPSSILNVFIPVNAHVLFVQKWLIEEGRFALFISNNIHIKANINVLFKLFVSQFAVYEQVAKHTVPQFNSSFFKSTFLGPFITHVLIDIENFSKVEELVGLSQMIRFYNPKPIEFYLQIHSAGVLLAHKLYLLGQYHEAYELYEDLTLFYCEENEGQVKARKSLFCFTYCMDQWLTEKTKEPTFTEKQKELILNLKILKSNLDSKDILIEQLYLLAKRMGEKYKKNNDEKTQMICKNYYSMFISVFCEKQKKEINSLINEPNSKQLKEEQIALKELFSKDVSVVGQKKSQFKSKVNPKKKFKSANKLILNSELKQEKEIIIIKEIKKEVVESEVLQEIKTEKKKYHEVKDKEKIVDVGKFSISFFNQKRKTVPKIQYIARSQLREEFISLLDELRNKFPDADFYYTGAGPCNLLYGIKPNDEDVLVINCSLDEISKFLKTKKLKPEMRSTKHSVVFCPLATESSIDFSAKFNNKNIDLNTILKKDFSGRDFNVNALYCKFTEANEFPIFSFSDALKIRNKKIINAIGEPTISLKNDPTRLFRLAKTALTYPDYTLGKALQKALVSMKGKWLDLLVDYVNKDMGNINRLDSAIRKLFIRYSYSEINQVFERLGILTELTNNTISEANKACAKISEMDSDNKYILWILANILQQSKDNTELNILPMEKFFKLSVVEYQFLQFTKERILNEDHQVHVYAESIKNLLKNFNLVDEVQQFELIN